MFVFAYYDLVDYFVKKLMATRAVSYKYEILRK